MICMKSFVSFRGALLQKVENHISFFISSHQKGSLAIKITRSFRSAIYPSKSPTPKTNHLNLPTRSFRSPSGPPKRVQTRDAEGGVRGFSSLFKPALFTLVIGGVSYTGASIWQYENLFKSSPRHSNHHSHGWVGEGVKRGGFRQEINFWWNSLTQGEKSVAGIIALNGFVFMLWRVPVLHVFMTRYFTASPMSSTSCLPMLLSTFSHHSVWHIAANMYVLWSFAPSITRLLGNEQFLATYLTAGVVSSLGSYVFKILNKSMIPSIGASGAIMAVLGMVCVKNPDARLSVAFISSIYPHSFSADTALKSLILLDGLGILLRWRLFDHAAHLAGVLFGIWYVTYGSRLIWQKREPLVRKWHQWRSGRE